MYMQADLHRITLSMLLRLTLYSNKCAPPFRSHGYCTQVADGVGGSHSVSGHSPGGIHSNLLGHLRNIQSQEGSQKKVTKWCGFLCLPSLVGLIVILIPGSFAISLDTVDYSHVSLVCS